MNTNKKIIILLSLILFFSACYKDVDIYDTRDFQPMLVINALNISDSSVYINLSRSAPPTLLTASDFITEARVKLYEDGKLIEEMTKANFFNHLDVPFFVSRSKTSPGHTYTIETEFKGKKVSGNFYIPQPVKIKDIKISFDQLDTDRYNTTYLIYGGGRLEIIFQDPDTANYYTVFGFTNNWAYWYDYDDAGNVQDSVLIKYPNNILLIDQQYHDNIYDEHREIKIKLPIFSFGQMFWANAYSDLSFNGQQKIFIYNFGFDITVQDLDSAYLYFVLGTLNEDYYKFYLTYNEYNDAVGNPFLEPVNVYSNVKNGLSIVAGMSIDVARVKIFK